MFLKLNYPRAGSAPALAEETRDITNHVVIAGFGRVVILDHGGRFYTLYGHLASVDVSKGAAVAAGDDLGTGGMAPTGSPAL